MILSPPQGFADELPHVRLVTKQDRYPALGIPAPEQIMLIKEKIVLRAEENSSQSSSRVSNF